MFIELTDHLRCTADHEESFLVLLPDEVRERHVIRGQLGCPVCGRVVPIVDGVAIFDQEVVPSAGSTQLDGPALTALLGLESPGGYLALVGAPGRLAKDLQELLTGVDLALVNPPAGVSGNVLRSTRLPIRSSSMRGVVLGADYSSDPAWREAAIEAVLPGNRIVVEGDLPVRDDLELLGQADGVSVARRPTAVYRRR